MRDQWLKPALLGVQSSASFDLAGPLGEFLARVAHHDDAALAFSRGVGALAACSLAAVTLLPAGHLIPVPADDDGRILPAEHAWNEAVTAAFAGGSLTSSFDTRLRYEACTQLADLGATLPSKLLPAALDAGKRSTTLRGALLPVLGPRGRWLAARNPDWEYASSAVRPTHAAAEVGQLAWQEASHSDRLAFFCQLRQQNPAAARELLLAGLGELPAKERIEFVIGVSVNLQPEDEVLLEPLLKDRSREVRATAASLLARLPDSVHARRLIAWLAPLVTLHKGLFGKKWMCEAPESADPAWAGAAIDAKRPPNESLGERAWWLYQIARQVPLPWWTATTGMTAGQLITWAGKGDWKSALLRGWRDRVDRDEPEWVEAMLGPDASELHVHSAELLALLPPSKRERHWPNSVDDLWKGNLVGDVIGSCALGETLSIEYSRPLLASLFECFADDRMRHDYSLRSHVLEMAALLHPDSLHGARPVTRTADETPAMSECALAFERIVHIRATLYSRP